MDISLVYTLIGITIFIIVFFSIPANIKLRKKMKNCNIKIPAKIINNNYEIEGYRKDSYITYTYEINYNYMNKEYKQTIPAKLLKRIIGPAIGIKKDIGKETIIFINPNNPKEYISQNEKTNVLFLSIFLPILPAILLIVFLIIINKL